MKAPRKKYKSVITIKLKNAWPEIVESQKLEQSHRENNRYRENFINRFR